MGRSIQEMTMLKKIVAGVAATAAVAACTIAIAANISGAGATFPAPVYAKWAETYKAQTGSALNYQAIGSGGGVRQINAGTVDFGASHKPLKPDDLASGASGEGLIPVSIAIREVV